MTSPPPDTDRVGAADARSPLVLIVDDNAKNLKLARDVLLAAGLQTLEATSGAEAIALAVEHLPDVILIDLGLPDMDGSDTARKLRERSRTAQIPVVALSSSPFAGSGDWFRAAGFVGYLEKPITVREFPDQVRRYCSAATRDGSGGVPAHHPHPRRAR